MREQAWARGNGGDEDHGKALDDEDEDDVGVLVEAMGDRLGADLSGVEIHDGAEAEADADELDARAFTVGQRIHFGAGELDPGTREGKRLLAHEVVHTVQNRGAGDALATKSRVSEPGDAAEVEADQLADALVDGAGPLTVRQAPSAAIHLAKKKKKKKPPPKKKKVAAKPPKEQPETKDIGAITADDVAELATVLSVYQTWASPEAKPVDFMDAATGQVWGVSTLVHGALEMAHTGKAIQTEDALHDWKLARKYIDQLVHRGRELEMDDVYLAMIADARSGIEAYLIEARATSLQNRELDNTGITMVDRAEVESFFLHASELLEGEMKLVEKAIGIFKSGTEKHHSKAAHTASGFLATAAVVLDLIKGPGEIEEKVEQMRERGQVGKFASAAEIVHSVVEYAAHGFEALAGFSSAISHGAEGGEEAVSALSKLANQSKHFKEWGHGAAKLAAWVGLIAAGAELVDAIEKGDPDAIVDAGLDVAEGGFGLMMAGAEAGGTLASLGISAGVAVWFMGVKGLLSSAGEMIDVINDAKADRKFSAAGAMVKNALDYEEQAGQMGAALLALEDDSDPDPAVKARVTARLVAEVADKKQRLAKNLARLGEQATTDKPDYVGFYSDLKKQLGSDALAILKKVDEKESRPEVLYAHYKTVYAGIERMYRYALKDYES